jgi:copper homeostasis protein
MFFFVILHFMQQMFTNSFLLEVCVDSVRNALLAQSAGAQRVEFCANLPEGGVTPSLAQIRKIRELLNIAVFVIIRPRGGDFLYDDTEFEIMQDDVRVCGETGCDGVVIGMLTSDGDIDHDRTQTLIDVARTYSMGVTFNRAFDRSADLFSSMETLIELGCDRILTSGGYNTAVEGADVIRRLIEQARNRITVMPGSGINADNAAELVRTTGAAELHGTFRRRADGGMRYRNTRFSRQDEEYGLLTTDVVQIRQIIDGITHSCVDI